MNFELIDAIALEYFCDTDGLYGTTLHDLFPTELTPTFPAGTQLFWHRFPNDSFNLDFCLRSFGDWQYVILGRQTVYHLPPNSIHFQPGFSETAPSDFSALTSDELRLFRHAGAAYEKLRRCLIAIIHFNDYSAPNKQQKWAINQSSLQRLSGCNRDAVKKFLVEHEKMVSRHNSLHGLTERHNTGKGRAGLKIEQVIFW